MKMEEEIFFGYELIKDNLTSFGFSLSNDKYIKKYHIHNDEFTALIEVNKDGVKGKIIDNNFDEEFPLFRNDKVVGEFVISLRDEYEKILKEIRDKCYKKVSFPDPQAVRIANYIYKTYKDKPDFPWAKYPFFGVFRNKDNNRWYALICNVEDNKLGPNEKGRFIINVKPNKEMFVELLKVDNIFRGWHMNKNSWLSISLSDYFPDEYVESLIDMSYEEVNGLSKVRIFPPKNSLFK